MAGPAVVGEKDFKVSQTPNNNASPPVPSRGPRVGYKKGFFIESADGNYKLIIGGYGQFQFNYLNENGEQEYTFRIRRARLAFKGHLFTPKFTYKLQLDLANFRTDLLLDFYVDYKILGKDLRVSLGQQNTPYIRQQLISSSAQMFVDRSLASKEFVNDDDVDTDGDGVADRLIKNGRDLGIMLHGTPFENKMEYQVAIFNGHGINNINLNNDFLYMTRLVWNVLGDVGYGYEGDYEGRDSPAVFLGGAANYNVRNITNDKVFSLGGETGIKYKGFAATAEFMFRHINPGDTLLDTGQDYGYYAQAGYFVIPKRMEIGARLSQVFLHGLQNDSGEVQLGINGFLYGNYLKLQTDYSYLPTNTKDGIEKNHRYRLRLQTKF